MSPSPSTSERPPRTAGEVLIDALVAHGVDTVFGIPGTHNLPIYDAIRLRSLRHVLMQHEQGCTYAADGYARSTGRPGVVVTTTGPGALNAAAALAQAWSDSIPVLVISPGMPTNHPSTGNGELHEMLDQLGAMSAVAETTYRVSTVEEIPRVVAACFNAMTTGRPGPAYLELPFDLLLWSADAAPVIAPVTRPPLPSAESVAAASSIARSAARPVIIAGGGMHARATASLLALAERLDAPVLTTFNGKGAMDESHALSAGAGLGRAAVRDALADSDLVIAVGTQLAPSDLWYGGVAAQPVIRIDIDPDAALANVQDPICIISDAQEGLAALVDALGEGSSARNDWTQQVVQLARQEATTRAKPWVRLCEGLDSALRGEGIIAGDSTMACYYGIASTVRLDSPGSYLYPTGFGTLGYGLPAAIGASIANPSRRVVCVEGDGGLMFTINELLAAARLGLSLPIVVVTNNGYGEIRRQMVARHGAAIAVDFPPPDLATLASAFGCRYAKADTAEAVESSIRDAWNVSTPTIIEVEER